MMHHISSATSIIPHSSDLQSRHSINHTKPYPIGLDIPVNDSIDGPLPRAVESAFPRGLLALRFGSIPPFPPTEEWVTAHKDEASKTSQSVFFALSTRSDHVVIYLSSPFVFFSFRSSSPYF